MQKESAGSTIKETIADFSMYCSEIEFAAPLSVKEPTSRSWYDEDGADEYIPSEGLKVDSYETDIKFCYKGDRGSANGKIETFLKYLIGADGDGASMKIYCDYTKEGRSGVRFVKLDKEATLVRDSEEDLVVMTMTFKVNAPTTKVTAITDVNGNITKLE